MNSTIDSYRDLLPWKTRHVSNDRTGTGVR